MSCLLSQLMRLERQSPPFTCLPARTCLPSRHVGLSAMGRSLYICDVTLRARAGSGGERSRWPLREFKRVRSLHLSLPFAFVFWEREGGSGFCECAGFTCVYTAHGAEHTQTQASPLKGKREIYFCCHVGLTRTLRHFTRAWWQNHYWFLLLLLGSVLDLSSYSIHVYLRIFHPQERYTWFLSEQILRNI